MPSGHEPSRGTSPSPQYLLVIDARRRSWRSTMRAHWSVDEVPERAGSCTVTLPRAVVTTPWRSRVARKRLALSREARPARDVGLGGPASTFCSAAPWAWRRRAGRAGRRPPGRGRSGTTARAGARWSRRTRDAIWSSIAAPGRGGSPRGARRPSPAAPPPGWAPRLAVAERTLAAEQGQLPEPRPAAELGQGHLAAGSVLAGEVHRAGPDHEARVARVVLPEDDLAAVEGAGHADARRPPGARAARGRRRP